MNADATATVVAVGAVDRQLAIEVTDATARAGIVALFAALLEPAASSAVMHLAVARAARMGEWTIAGADAPGRHACGPDGFTGSLESVLWYLRYQATRAFVASRPDLVWLHAAGVVRDGRAMLMAGASGSGKSTLATRLARRGFRCLGDEVIPIEPETMRARPFVMTPAARAATDGWLAPGEVRRLPKVDVPLARDQIAVDPCPVGVLLFPSYARPAPGSRGDTQLEHRHVEGAAIEPLSPSHAALELLRHLVDVADGPRAMRAMAAVASAAPAVRLQFDDVEAAVGMAEQHHAVEPSFAR